jgi:hypothetical protein
MGETFVRAIEGTEITIANQNTILDSNAITEDHTAIDPYVHEVLSLNNRVLIIYLPSPRVDWVLDKFIELGGKPGDYFLVGSFWWT